MTLTLGAVGLLVGAAGGWRLRRLPQRYDPIYYAVPALIAAVPLFVLAS